MGVGTEYSAYPAVGAQVQESAAALRGREAIAKIKEVGFRTYVEELNKEKLEELREKILQSMGLSEEDLAGMSANQRAAIEKMISEEMQRQMAANSLANKGDDEGKGKGSLEGTVEFAAQMSIGQRMGLDLLDDQIQLLGQEETEGPESLVSKDGHDKNQDRLFG
ncbi:hypothetical protein [Aestuariispira insulae]|uniref:Uncharacterized protein n=1 Tax=Aestuariispira insulae TaxID=1461337 RepID=A0A3D9HS61_9PROT|nr:hypothetical protein [Aestuariispira insulae]RED52332.1 hypothetical protein DFP90_102352 [Aestuariispira insulae]